MKKISTVFAIIGFVAMVATAGLVLRFGASSMRRVEADASRWRMEWASRR